VSIEELSIGGKAFEIVANSSVLLLGIVVVALVFRYLTVPSLQLLIEMIKKPIAEGWGRWTSYVSNESGLLRAELRDLGNKIQDLQSAEKTNQIVVNDIGESVITLHEKVDAHHKELSSKITSLEKVLKK